MTVREFQRLIEEIYFEKDKGRGVHGTFTWFVEEVGELARAIKSQDAKKLNEEFADVFAWLATLASLHRVDLEDAARKYALGCPKCGHTPCECGESL